MAEHVGKDKDGNAEPQTTARSGQARVKNEWGVDLAQITLRHRRGNDPGRQEEQAFYSIPQGSTTPYMAFTYETGAFSPFDYWWVKFMTVGGDSWQCKDNFYCSVSSSDNGKVDLTLNGDSTDMSVKFSSSSGCTVNIYRPS